MATIGRCQQRVWKRKLVQEKLEAPELTNYEKERLERIKRNRQVLDELEVVEASKQLQQLTNKPKSKPRPKQTPAIEVPVVPSRRSSRIAGQVAVPVPAEAAAAAVDSDKPVASSLLIQEEYFQLIGKELTPLLESDGRYKGWVSPGVCKMYGIAGNAAEAWHTEGGGAFSRRPDMAAVPTQFRAKGWSDAKAFAATMLRKNPNTYFYRHVAPHEQQAQGEWTEEEQQLFLKTAKEHGVGDKWGLFASHIPQRVGYQCSAYYRDVIVAQGFILDKRFRMTPSGHAVFVG